MNAITRTYRSHIAAPAEELNSWHRQPGAFERLTPAWAGTRLLEARGHVAPGDWKKLRIQALGPLGFTWKLVHTHGDTPLGFADIQESGPFSAWRHVHRFIPETESSSFLEDAVTFELPAGSAGMKLAGDRIASQLDRLFLYRHRVTQLDVERHFNAPIPRPSRIAVTGSSGLVGSSLVAFLQAGGHQVVRMVRHEPRDAGEVYWNPATGEIDARALEGIDAVINLAGASIAGKRWTRKRKEEILRSRVDGTRLLAETLAGLSARPAVLVSASAVGFYGNGAAGELNEQSARGDGFLAEVCEAWEAAAAPAERAGIRVVHPRLGIVLSGDSGMLPLLARVFRMGAGGPLGDGSQAMSWIALDDLLGMLLEAIANPDLKGPVNAVAPEPVTNRDFASALGDVLNRPSFLPTPAVAMRLAAGQMAEELILTSQRVRPERILSEGFSFAFPEIGMALRHELGRFERASAALPAGEPMRARLI